MDNQNLNNNEVPIQGSQNINVVDTQNNVVTQVGNTPVQEEVVVQPTPAPSLMRESVDRNGNVVYIYVLGFENTANCYKLREEENEK